MRHPYDVFGKAFIVAVEVMPASQLQDLETPAIEFAADRMSLVRAVDAKESCPLDGIDLRQDLIACISISRQPVTQTEFEFGRLFAADENDQRDALSLNGVQSIQHERQYIRSA